jgi:hypothetical protein
MNKNYIIYIDRDRRIPYNIFGIDETKLTIIKNGYLNGNETFTIAGVEYSFKDLIEIKIFTHRFYFGAASFEKQCEESGLYVVTELGNYLPKKALASLGDDITESIIGNAAYGQDRKIVTPILNTHDFIDHSRIAALKDIKIKDFDLIRLIKYCEELNFNFKYGNYLSVAMLSRAIIDHIPPIFGKKTFAEVANNYGTQSFKNSTKTLDQSLRNIADNFLHQTIRKRESLPVLTQVNFSQSLDVLLSEIIRFLNE